MRLLPLLILLTGCVQAGSTTGFVHVPMTGTHEQTSCSDCHGESTENRSAYLCIDCHLEDRPEPHDPGGCATCHSMNDWFEAGIDHDRFFPLPHEGNDACADCHPDASNRAVFTCIDCHAHRRSEMDDEHQGEAPGYRYESNACLDCHPNGEEDD